MYQILLFSHNSMRWLVVGSLLYAIFRAYNAYRSGSKFTKTDNTVRYWTVTFSHIQLTLGAVLYFESPLTKYFMANFKDAVKVFDISFFGLVHSSIMFTAVMLITVGSAKSKREETDSARFKTMVMYFSIAFLLIFVAIPWPFSPFAARPYFR